MNFANGQEETTEWDAVQYQFQVSEDLYGMGAAKTATVIADFLDTSCGNGRFTVGAKYLVVAGKDGDTLIASTSMCSRTSGFDESSNELALLRESKQGNVRPRLWGWITEQRLRLDGDYEEKGYLNSRPMAGVQVTAQGVSGRFVTKSDRQGRFTFIGLPSGDYEVLPALTNGRAIEYPDDHHVTLDRCSAHISFLTAVTSLKGVLRTQDGSPVGEGALLWIVPVDRSGAEPTEDRSKYTLTDRQGAWAFRGVEPGRYRIGVNIFNRPSPSSPYRAQWYPSSERSRDAAVIVVSDANTVEISMRVAPRLPARHIKGIVTGVNGKPIVEAGWVALYDVDEPDGTGAVSFGHFDVSGVFTVEGLEGHRYRIKADSFGKESLESELQDVPEDPSVIIRLVLTQSRAQPLLTPR